MSYPRRGIFVTGTNTDVGKTYVAALLCQVLRDEGVRVGVYKPAASGCQRIGTELVSDDAVALWEAAGRPLDLPRVCPQLFAAPLAPHLAARHEGRELDESLLLDGAAAWRGQCDLLIVEGAGGLMSPMGDEIYVADLAYELGYPLLVVAANELGVINQTLQTLITAATFRDGLQVAGVILNDVHAKDADTGGEADVSVDSNFAEIQQRIVPPLLCHIGWGERSLPASIRWSELAER